MDQPNTTPSVPAYKVLTADEIHELATAPLPTPRVVANTTTWAGAGPGVNRGSSVVRDSLGW